MAFTQGRAKIRGKAHQNLAEADRLEAGGSDPKNWKVEGLRDAFHEAVDDYIETCMKIGKEPQKAFSGQVMFRVDPEVHRKAALAAEMSGKSLNQWAEEVLGRAAG